MRYLYIVLFLCAIGNQGFAQRVSKVGTSAAQFLKIPVGARSTALGGAVTSGVNDISAMYWNPSALTNLKQPEVTMEYSDWFLDLSHSFIGIAFPTGDKSTFGFSLNIMNFGDFDETTFDNPEGTGRTFGAMSFAAGVSYAHILFDGFSIGGTFKYINETIWNTSASTIAFDLGTTFVTPFDGIVFAASITNAGGRLQMTGDDLLIVNTQIDGSTAEFQPGAFLKTDEFDLPLQMRIGMSWQAIERDFVKGSFMIDGANPSDNKQSVSLGTEWMFLNDVIALRAGLPDLFLDDRTQLFAAGFGINYELNSGLGFNFGYAYQDFEALAGTHRLSFSLKF